MGGRESLGLPADKLWYVSPETYEYFDGHKKELAAKYDAWQETFAAWETANPELAKKYADAQAGVVPDLDSMMAEFEVGSGVATRNAGAEVLQPIAESMPFYVSGSADLHGSNKNYMKGVGDFSKNNYAGRNFYYGIRVVSMPCMELFERQSAEYIESVLPAAMKSKTVACEAGVTLPWYKFADKV